MNSHHSGISILLKFNYHRLAIKLDNRTTSVVVCESKEVFYQLLNEWNASNPGHYQYWASLYENGFPLSKEESNKYSKCQNGQYVKI